MQTNFVKPQLLDQQEWTFVRSSEPNAKTIAIIGGVHGNEPQSMKGVEKVRNWLQFHTALGDQILNKANFLIIPTINRIGALAEARCCPNRDTLVNYVDGKVIVGSDEKGSIKIPEGWSDPNRYFDERNNTLVKEHLVFIINHYKPDFMICHHDWIVPQAILGVYGAELMPNINFANATEIFHRYYPARKPFGEQWKFVIDKINEEQVNDTMQFGVLEKCKIPSVIIENSLSNPNSPYIHLLSSIFSACKFLNLMEDDKQLCKIILEQTSTLQ